MLLFIESEVKLMNKEVLRSAIYQKMMNKALTMIAEEAFFLALPYSFAELSNEDKQGLHGYVTEAIEHFGGARAILNNSIERNVNDAAKKRYVTNIYNICNEIASEAAERIVNETSDDAEFSKTIQDTNFTEEEFKKFETKADDLELEEIGKIISDKVVATIKGEQEAFENEQIIDQKINEIIAGQNDTDNEEEIQKGVESFYKMALENDNPRHHVSLFSKLVESATEAIATLYPNDEGIGIRALSDVTFLFSLSSYRKDMSATEAMDRLVSVDASLINDNKFMSSALESLEDQNTMKKAFVVGATAYTFMETMKTLNFVNPQKREIEAFINTSHTPASYGNYAVESFIKKSMDVFKTLNQDIRSMNSVEELLDYKKYYEEMSEKMDMIGIASESFVGCKEVFQEMIADAYKKIDNRCESLLQIEPEMSSSERVAYECDLAALNRIHAVYNKRTDIDHFTITYNDQTKSNMLVFEGRDAMESPLTSSSIYLEGLTAGKDAYKYVQNLVYDSKIDVGSRSVKFHTTSGFTKMV